MEPPDEGADWPGRPVEAGAPPLGAPEGEICEKVLVKAPNTSPMSAIVRVGIRSGWSEKLVNKETRECWILGNFCIFLRC